MANLHILRKRYKSIQATADMSAAMKTAASVKYAKISKVLSNIDAYSRACDEALALLGGAGLGRETNTVKSRNCLVVFSSDRGFCGGFNSELLRFFEIKMTAESEPPLLLAAGQKAAAFCQSRNYEFERIALSEIPVYQEAETLTERLLALYTSGEADQIRLIYQRYDNMMTQTPVMETVLPHPMEADVPTEDILFLPDRETTLKGTALYCLTNSIYRIMLGHAAGAQAATSIAMRSACDNAEKSLAKLEILINRIRQSEVTNSVIETSSSLAGQTMEN